MNILADFWRINKASEPGAARRYHQSRQKRSPLAEILNPIGVQVVEHETHERSVDAGHQFRLPVHFY